MNYAGLLESFYSIHFLFQAMRQKEIYEIRVYKMKTAEQMKATDNYLERCLDACHAPHGNQTDRCVQTALKRYSLVKEIIVTRTLYFAGCMAAEQNQILMTIRLIQDNAKAF